MRVSRRTVLRWIALTGGAAMGSAGVLGATRRLAHALATQPGSAPLVWLTGGADDLGLLAQLGRSHPGLLERVFTQWDVAAYDGLAPVGTNVPERVGAAPILIVEHLPGAEGEEPLWDALTGWAKQAKTVICVGTEACYGGAVVAPASARRLTRLCRAERTPLIKLPGVPVPPHHLIGTLAYMQYVGFPRLDGQYRPELYYSDTVCAACERRGDLEDGRFASALGEAGCLLRLGCKGPFTHNTCAAVRWNGGVNWCVGAGGPCTGCAEPGFPDHGGLGLYGRVPGSALAARSFVLENLDLAGQTLLGLTALGIGLHVVRRRLERKAVPRPRRAGSRAEDRERESRT